MHVHSCYSRDGISSLEDIVERCKQINLSCIALCDHGTVEGALRLQETAPFTVIVAEEILTPVGEIMGLFLTHTIPSGIPVQKAVEEIKKQGGLVCLPHPFDRYRRSAIKEHAVQEIMPYVDVVETFNSCTLPFQNLHRPRQLATKYNLPQSAGSDAHAASEIGNVHMTMRPFHNPTEFLESLRGGQVHGHSTNLLCRTSVLIGRIRKRFK